MKDVRLTEAIITVGELPVRVDKSWPDGPRSFRGINSAIDIHFSVSYTLNEMEVLDVIIDALKQAGIECSGCCLLPKVAVGI